jgi:hypothetical protein
MIDSENTYFYHNETKCDVTNLSVVDLLLEGVVCDESVYVRNLFLAVSVDPADGLTVMAWVPRCIEHDHTISAHQIDAQALECKKHSLNVCPAKLITVGL